MYYDTIQPNSTIVEISKILDIPAVLGQAGFLEILWQNTRVGVSVVVDPSFIVVWGDLATAQSTCALSVVHLKFKFKFKFKLVCDECLSEFLPAALFHPFFLFDSFGRRFPS